MESGGRRKKNGKGVGEEGEEGRRGARGGC